MRKFIGAVEDTFEIGGRGVVVALNVGWPDDPSEFILKIGDRIEFRFSEVVLLSSHIAGIDMIIVPPGTKAPIVFLLPKDVRKDEVSLTSEVWKLS
jgi:hypothetical protein